MVKRVLNYITFWGVSKEMHILYKINIVSILKTSEKTGKLKKSYKFSKTYFGIIPTGIINMVDYLADNI